MTAQVVLRQRLLDEQQVVRVEPRELAGVSQRVGGVGVDLQGDVTEPLADRGDRCDVPARLDLELDPQVTLRQVGVDRVEQLRHGVHDADADPGGDGVAHRAEVVREAAPGRAQLGVEHRQLERRLGHLVALDRLERGRDAGSGQPVAHGREARDEEAAQHLGGPVDVLGAVERLAHRDALAPALGLGRLHPDQQHLPPGDGPEGGAERRHQRQLDAVEVDGGQLHAGRSSSRYQPERVNPVAS